MSLKHNAGMKTNEKRITACRWLAIFLICAACAPCINGVVLGIDFGGENIKATLVQAGRTPISIVLTEMTKRKSPALVAFHNGERLVGEAASNIGVRFPTKIVSGAKSALGKHFDQVANSTLFKWNTLVKDENRSTVLFETEGGIEYSAEELVGMILEQIAYLGGKQAATSIVDVVISVPAFFTQEQRTALGNAAEMAGLSAMSFISEHAAAALQYGIERNFESNSTHTIAIFDMGATKTSAAIVQYSVAKGKDGKDVPAAQVLEVKWDEGAGGLEMDSRIAEYLADEFDPSIKTNPRGMAKLLKGAKKAKEILSANTEAPVFVEAVDGDRDFSTTLTREKLEEMAGDLFSRAAEVLKAAVTASGVELKDIVAIEGIGGCTRIPGVQAAVAEFLDGRAIERHIDGDEAIAMGTGLAAANISTTFRMRKFWLQDVFPAEFSVKVSGVDDKKTLMKYGSPFPKSFGVAVPAEKALAQDEITVDIFRDGEELTNYSVSGLKDAIEKRNNTGELKKVSIGFSMQSSGILESTNSYAVFEVTEMVPVKSKAKSENVTTGESSKGMNETDTPADDSAAAGNETETDKPDVDETNSTVSNSTATNSTAEEQVQYKEKKKTVKSQLKTVGGELPILKITKENMKSSIRKLKDLKAKDIEKRLAEQSKDELERYIIDAREKLRDEDSGVFEVSPEDERDDIISQLMDAEDWIYMDGENSDAAGFQAKLKGLKDKTEPIFQRLAEKSLRPEAVDKAKSTISLYQSIVNEWEFSKPWITDEEKEKAQKALDDLSSWLEDKEEAQSKLTLFDNPAFLASEVDSKVEKAEKKVLQIGKKPKPPPPPPPKNDTIIINETIIETQGGENETLTESINLDGNTTASSNETESSSSEDHDELKR